MKIYIYIIIFLLTLPFEGILATTNQNEELTLDSLLNIKKIELDSIKVCFECKSNILKGEILSKINIDSIPLLTGYNYDNPSLLLSNILKKGDLDYFESIMETEIWYHENFDFGPYALYMAEKYNSITGYYFVWLAYIAKNRNKKVILRERYVFLENLDDDEKCLAFVSLIKAAQMKRSGAISFLSDCFRYGAFVNKDIAYADLLIKAKFYK